MAAAEASLRSAGSLDVPSLASVFASANGDGVVIDAILRMLASTPHAVSPTQFHNSVHNAPSGYWGIAMRATPASTSLCGYDGSLACGLIEKHIRTTVEQAASEVPGLTMDGGARVTRRRKA